MYKCDSLNKGPNRSSKNMQMYDFGTKARLRESYRLRIMLSFPVLPAFSRETYFRENGSVWLLWKTCKRPYLTTPSRFLVRNGSFAHSSPWSKSQPTISKLHELPPNLRNRICASWHFSLFLKMECVWMHSFMTAASAIVWIHLPDVRVTDAIMQLKILTRSPSEACTSKIVLFHCKIVHIWPRFRAIFRPQERERATLMDVQNISRILALLRSLLHDVY